MARRITNYGERVLTRRMTRQDLGALQLHLLVGAVKVADSVTLAELTTPAFAGYAAVTLANASWAVPETNGDGIADTSYPEITYSYTAAAAESITGIAWTLSGETDVIIVEKLENPIPIVGTDSFAITPRLLGHDPSDA